MYLSEWRAFGYPDGYYRVWITNGNNGVLPDGSNDYACVIGRGILGTGVDELDTWGYRAYKAAKDITDNPYLATGSGFASMAAVSLVATEKVLDYMDRNTCVYRASRNVFAFTLGVVSAAMAKAVGEANPAAFDALFTVEVKWTKAALSGIALTQRYLGHIGETIHLALTDAVNQASHERARMFGGEKMFQGARHVG